MPTDPHKLPRTPWRVALLTFLAVAIGGAVILAVVFAVRNGGQGRDAFDAGQEMSRGLCVIAAVCAGVAYYVQKRRTGG